MKCPHCEYQHGWDSEIMLDIKGSVGEFFQSPVKLTQERRFETERHAYLMGCPECKKTFIGDC